MPTLDEIRANLPLKTSIVERTPDAPANDCAWHSVSCGPNCLGRSVAKSESKKFCLRCSKPVSETRQHCDPCFKRKLAEEADELKLPRRGRKVMK